MNHDLPKQIIANPNRQALGGRWVRLAANRKRGDESGFSILEAVIALVLMLVVALGAVSLFSYSVYNNSGGTDRATSLAIAQQRLEMLRSAQFNSVATDPILNAGPPVTSTIVLDGRAFSRTVAIDDNPATQAIDVNVATNLKGITVTVVPRAIGQGWAFGGGGTITLFTQRSRTNR